MFTPADVFFGRVPQLAATRQVALDAAYARILNASCMGLFASILGAAERFSRALTLHQISIEECNKLEMLGATVASLLTGLPVDFPKLVRAMRQHKVKNHQKAYFNVRTAEERDADPKRATEIFEAQQKAFHQLPNTNKNGSLYVDYLDGKFVAPAEAITESMAEEIRRVYLFFRNRLSSVVWTAPRMAAIHW